MYDEVSNKIINEKQDYGVDVDCEQGCDGRGVEIKNNCSIIVL